ncbi:hypothetical protein Tco_0179817 [Tanacetum coccineum]
MLAKSVQEEQELSEQQLKRKAEVQKVAQFYTEEDWDTIRAKLEANTEVVKNLQGESISNDDFAKRMVEMINEKKKLYAKQKAKAKDKHSFEELKTEFEKLMKIQQGKKAYVKDKVKDASSELEIGVDPIPTAIKPPTIVKWKIISQSSQKAAYQIIRKDGSDKIYMSFGAILKDFSRDDLIELYRLVIKKYGENRPEEMYDRIGKYPLSKMLPSVAKDELFRWRQW